MVEGIQFTHFRCFQVYRCIWEMHNFLTESHCGDTFIVGRFFMCSISNFCIRCSLNKKCPTQALETHLESFLRYFVPILEKGTCPKNWEIHPNSSRHSSKKSLKELTNYILNQLSGHCFLNCIYRETSDVHSI